MDHSRNAAAIIGPVAVALAVSLFANPGLIADMADSIANDPALIVLSGVLVMVAGLAILRGEGPFGPVKALGWLFVLGGIARIVAVHQIADLTAQVGQHPEMQMIGAAVIGVIGLFFTWLGWFAPARAEAPTSYES